MNLSLICDLGVIEITSILEVIVLAITAVIAWLGLKMNREVNRKTRVWDMLHVIQDDCEMREAFYTIEYNSDWYNSEFHNSAFGMKVDKLLAYFNYFCLLYKSKFLSNAEFELIKYRLTRVLKNPSTIEYLHFLYDWSRRVFTRCSYEELLQYAQTHAFEGYDFYSPIIPKQ